VGWATIRTIGILATSVALTALFAIVEHTASAPLLPLRILRVRTVAGGNLVLVGAGMAVDGMLFTVTLYTQRVLGYSAIRFGCTMAAMTATSVAGSYLAQRLVTRAGTRPVAAGGAALLGVSCVVLATLPVKGGLGILLSGLLVFGLGMGGAFVAGSIASLTGAGEQESGVAAGLQSTSFGVGTALGVALLSTVAVLSTPHLAATGQAAHLTVLADGYRAAFDAAVVVAALTVLAAVAFLSAAAPRATGRSARPVRRTGRHLHPHTPPVPGASSAMTNRNAATSSQREGQTP
jgi:MFS family permease